MSSSLDLVALAHSYGDGTRSLSQVSVGVPAGDDARGRGPSGSGKSTLLRVAAGLLARSPVTCSSTAAASCRRHRSRGG